MSAVLEATGLVKHYTSGTSLFQSSKKPGKEPVKAVDGVSFRITEGICFGFLGPNGAGKTTTVEMLEGITQPTAGDVRYRGAPLDDAFRERIGIMFQNTALQDYMTVIEALRMFSRFYRHTESEQTLIEQCALGEFLDRDTRKLSGGQKQRLLLAMALVNDPDVVFLDEPTTGLDPQARRNFWRLVDSIKQRGKTVVLTTHYMEEASLLCDELIFMDHGKIIAEGKPRELLSDRFNDVMLQLPAENWLGSGQPELAGQQPAGQELVVEGDVVQIRTPDIDATVDWLRHHQVSVSGLEVRARSLEDLFIELTGQELRA